MSIASTSQAVGVGSMLLSRISKDLTSRVGLWGCCQNGFGRLFSSEPPSSIASSDAMSTGGVPWPWVDPNGPRILPYYVPNAYEAKRILAGSIPEAIQTIQEDVKQRKAGTSELVLKSGRARESKKSPASRSDEAIEMVLQLKLDKAAGKELQATIAAVKGSVVLPFGTGQQNRIAVIASGPQAELAREAGADIVGDEALIETILAEGKAAVDFTKLVVTPVFMKSIARAGRILGPKGLMPNAKAGTLTDDVAGAVKLLRKGILEFKADKYGNVHATVGKSRFTTNSLMVNIGAYVKSLLDIRPKGIPGEGLDGYFDSFILKATRSSPVRLSTESCEAALEAFTEHQRKNNHEKKKSEGAKPA